MSNLNRIILIGRLADKPEARTTMEGTAVTKFVLTTARPAGAGSDDLDIVCWRELAEAASQHLNKGDLALVEGRIQIRKFQDQAGNQNWATEIVARRVQPIGAKAATVQTSAAAPVSHDDVEELPEDDLPF